MKRILLVLLMLGVLPVLRASPGCIPASEEAIILTHLRERISEMRALGWLPAARPRSRTSLLVPVRPAPGYNAPGFYNITFFVDGDPEEGRRRDFNCGGRTYDGHTGTDFVTYPFPWQNQESNMVWVTAAAAGTIIDRRDGNFDRECFFDFNFDGSRDWNAVYLRHDDGSLGLYGHLKNGSLTAKRVGDRVEAGEYLGVVGSSGYSNVPHLHFSYYATESDRRSTDPFAGPCNEAIGSSAWADQPPYAEEQLLRLTLHPEDPVLYQPCPVPDRLFDNRSTEFSPGDRIFPVMHLANSNGGRSEQGFIDATGDTVMRWQTVHPTTQSWQSLFTEQRIPPAANTGIWRFYGRLGNGTSTRISFVVREKLNRERLGLNAYSFPNEHRLFWSTPSDLVARRYIIETQPLDSSYFKLDTVMVSITTGPDFVYRRLAPPGQTVKYRLLLADVNDKRYVSEPVSVSAGTRQNDLAVAGNPFRNGTQLLNYGNRPVTYGIFSATGKILSHGEVTAYGSVNIDAMNWPVGTYWLSWRQEGERKVIKMIRH